MAGITLILVIILVVVVVVILAVIGFAIGTFNKLVTMRNRYKNAYAQIDVQLKRRYDLIPNLVETAKGYMKHESGTLEEVTKARNIAYAASQAAAANPGDTSAMKNLTSAETGLAGTLSRLMMVSEAYPDLKLTWDGPPGHPFVPYYYAFFDVMTHPVTRRYLSEDYAFCERWRAIGGVIHIDTKSDLIHQGFRLYRGNFEESLNHNIALTIGGPVGQKMILKRATPA